MSTECSRWWDETRWGVEGCFVHLPHIAISISGECSTHEYHSSHGQLVVGLGTTADSPCEQRMVERQSGAYFRSRHVRFATIRAMGAAGEHAVVMHGTFKMGTATGIRHPSLHGAFSGTRSLPVCAIVGPRTCASQHDPLPSRSVVSSDTCSRPFILARTLAHPSW